MSNLSKSIREYFYRNNHWISYVVLDSSLDIKTNRQKSARRVAIKRLVDKGILTPHPTEQGVYIKLKRVR